ncbi:flagellar hook assembly protein FlgD [Blastopirellula marina]|uniref:Basal-body rod modification protein FlgD n=1 Tax=Blastopirellula marina TaxID=124 RepID=A0A2S8F267_9BACT|nr:flagellar hook capping FlgD N-terminal domain-containing protein [Blastopirellula marina]PQO26261.1 flagellar biosynthesis protein FlgD [Blastopirellula marina]PTL40661.1 flagellar biosynthesis protein FlgD [Blastopirellula marina]
MSSVGGTGSTSSSGASTGTAGGGLQDLDMDQFLKLMLAELQNQDPLEPMKNSEMLQQIGQIRSITATEQLSTTLTNVLDGQNILSATTLIGGQVQALTNEGDVVFGVVTGAQITPNDDGVREVFLKVLTDDGVATVRLDDIFTVLPSSAGQAPEETDGTDSTAGGTDDTTDGAADDSSDDATDDSAAAA